MKKIILASLVLGVIVIGGFTLYFNGSLIKILPSLYGITIIPDEYEFVFNSRTKAEDFSEKLGSLNSYNITLMWGRIVVKDRSQATVAEMDSLRNSVNEKSFYVNSPSFGEFGENIVEIEFRGDPSIIKDEIAKAKQYDSVIEIYVDYGAIKVKNGNPEDVKAKFIESGLFSSIDNLKNGGSHPD